MPFQSPEIATEKKSVVAAGMKVMIPQSPIANPCPLWCWLGCGQSSRAVFLSQPVADDLAMPRAVIAFKMAAMDDFDRQIIDAFHGSAVVVSI